MQFSLDVSRWVTAAKGDVRLVIRRVTLDMFVRVVLMSPVGNPDLWVRSPPPGYVGGRFRANWQVGTNMMPDGVIDAVDPSGSTVIAKITREALALEPGMVIWLVNNLPYAIPLEYGWSTQAPGGMVRITVAEFQRFATEAARSTRGRKL